MATTPSVANSAARRYSLGAIILHWLIAIAVIVNWRIAETAHDLPKELGREVMGYHMAWGMGILVLTVLRILWRLTHPAPPYASHLKSWEVALARVTHSLFYILLISLPMLGWVAMSSYGNAISMFGWFDWPVLPLPKNPDAAGTVFDIHETLGKAMLLLIALHIAGVVKHMVFDRDGNLFRMLPFGKVRD
ncbi:MAG TPA: cytochrome b [Novosphingobium sp.]|nr:cytochrome b [Novosphingobium sp.]